MLVDMILDRRDGDDYDAYALYRYLMGYEYPTYQQVSRAMDEGTELDVKKALCDYIDADGFYNPEIKEYINSVNWLD